MYAKRIILLLGLCLYTILIYAQHQTTEEEADEKTLVMFTAQQWKILLAYGKDIQQQGIDFPILRMRMGYAAFALENYSESLKQYEKAYANDNHNYVSLYYSYLNCLYLNRIDMARYYVSKMKVETQQSEKQKKYALASCTVESSQKIPDIPSRGNGFYNRIGTQVYLGYRVSIDQSIAYYHQTISEPKMKLVEDNHQIQIRQKEYYAQLAFTAGPHTSLLGGFHYIYTPFNNYVYHNAIGFAGVRYVSPYWQGQAMLHTGHIGDSVYNQADAVITIHPFGNTKLYSISKAMIGKDFAFSEIVGCRVAKKCWVEANITASTYRMLLDNNSLYLFNDIDTKKQKWGASVYIQILPKLIGSANYGYEKKLAYGTKSSYFHQQSFTETLLWKF